MKKIPSSQLPAADNDQSYARYPLIWKAGQARIPSERRQYSRFKKSFAEAYGDLVDETERVLSVAKIEIYSNVPLRADGLPVCNKEGAAPCVDDPGVVLRFHRNGKPYAIAVDHYDRVYANVRAIYIAMRNLREIERHGVSSLSEESFAGFRALPAADPEVIDPPWYKVLDLKPEATAAEIEDAFKNLARKHHPDMPGGNHEKFVAIGRARMLGEAAAAQRVHRAEDDKKIWVGIDSAIGLSRIG